MAVGVGLLLIATCLDSAYVAPYAKSAKSDLSPTAVGTISTAASATSIP